ncbi:DNA polymerase III subunit alpha [uncultured Draconibacterium sp.]|uniref:DNA polymerase III subunit alpha n=1 Tax=uncultured Draconibacterium sp. TaxID=1573823 RepID=UPI003217ED60
MLLNCHTYYSYKFGTISIDQLIEEAIDKNYHSLVLTDINNTSAAIDFIRRCQGKDLKPVVGVDFRNGAGQKYIGIAKNNQGFRELNEHLTFHLHSGKEFADRAPIFLNAFVVYPLGSIHPKNLNRDEFIGVRPSEINKLFGDLRNYPEKLVILQPVTFRNKRDFNVHRLLRTMDNNTLLSRLPKSEEASPNEIMQSRNEILYHFRDFPQIIENTQGLIKSCFIDFTFKQNKNKRCYTSSSEEDFKLLSKLAWDGILYRFGEPSPRVVARMEKELKIIRQMDFSAYFLINWDLVEYARSQGCYYVGRGSGANSMVAYLLRITDVDPLELDLYFERFINPSRQSPPDFDIDFASRDRDRITRYIFDRHGWNKTALVGTYITFQYKSMIRELGKVFGLPAHEIEKLQATKDFSSLDDIGKLVLQYSQLIHGFPSHLSVHSSGILISEEPISAYTATIMPPKGFPTIHFSMLEAEDLGFAKFDILGQRGLSKIEDAIRLVHENTGDEIDIHDLKTYKDDDRIKELLKHGNTIGCFYVESPAMRMLLTKLEADDYLRLVAASSIIRPGVAQSGMMREYILRYRDRSRCVEAQKEAPALYELLEETYGVMVYQEDVIKVAHLFAGLTLAESDILRRGMSWKFKQRNEFGKIKDKFFSNCEEKGYDYALVTRVWTQIESFANYAFSKGHSASYAVESYQALFIKAYYPLEYIVATINNGGGFYRTELYVHEARMHGAKIFPPCINRSENQTVINGNVIHLGFGFLKSLETTTINAILNERYRGGYYRSLQDFLGRVPISLEQLSILIRVGAFNFTRKSKKELLWNAHFILAKSKKTAPERTLFQQEVKEFTIPELYYHPLENAYDEIELLGFPITRSTFELLENMPLPKTLAADLPQLINQNVVIVGSLVHVKRTRANNAKTMSFGVFIDFKGHWIDTVQFPQIAARYPFSGGGCYLIKGKVVEEFGFISIEVAELYRLPNENMEEPSTRLKAPDKSRLLGEYYMKNVQALPKIGITKAE